MRSRSAFILSAFLLAGIAGAVAEGLFLPYLVSTPLYFVLTLATTVVVAGSLGLTVSGYRRRLPRAVRVVATTFVTSLAALTAFVLVGLPFLGAGSTRHDRAVTFAVVAPSPVQAITESPMPSPAQPVTPSPLSPPAPAARTAMFNHGAGPDTVSGTASLGRTADGAAVLRLSGLDATPGPDLYVYLDRVENPAGVQATAGVLVSALKTYRGDFTFQLDPALDLAQFKSVAIYCRSYNVVFGYANLG